MWLPTEFPQPFPEPQHKVKGAEETLLGSACWSCTRPHIWAGPVSWPARWPHLGFREVPLASPFLASASSCSSSSPSADSTWEKRRVTVSRALVCGERGSPTVHQGPRTSGALITERVPGLPDGQQPGVPSKGPGPTSPPYPLGQWKGVFSGRPPAGPGASSHLHGLLE